MMYPEEWSYGEIEEAANSTRHQYSIGMDGPIDIEGLIEFDLKINLIPCSGLKESLGIDGWLSGDLNHIAIDKAMMRRHPARYRFTLAHELGHLFLHAEYIRAHRPATIPEWRAMQMDARAELLQRMEQEANHFAGCLLVPRQHLYSEWRRLQRELHRNKFSIENLDDYDASKLAEQIAKDLGVSLPVVLIALRRYSVVG